jgi:hypothetical protein
MRILRQQWIGKRKGGIKPEVQVSHTVGDRNIWVKSAAVISISSQVMKRTPIIEPSLFERCCDAQLTGMYYIKISCTGTFVPASNFYVVPTCRDLAWLPALYFLCFNDLFSYVYILGSWTMCWPWTALPVVSHSTSHGVHASTVCRCRCGNNISICRCVCCVFMSSTSLICFTLRLLGDVWSYV